MKTFKPGNATCSVGLKAERTFGPSFFWVLAGIPYPKQDASFEYYIIPAKVMASNVLAAYKLWLKTPGVRGQSHNPNIVRTVHLPPRKSLSGWDISKYRDKWKLIEQRRTRLNNFCGAFCSNIDARTWHGFYHACVF